MPGTVFQESAAKIAIGFSSQINIFENTAFGHVIEVHSKSILSDISIWSRDQSKGTSIFKGSKETNFSGKKVK